MPTSEQQISEQVQQPPLPAIAAALRQCMDQIIHNWCHAVRAYLPDADELTQQQIENSMPKLLQDIATTLELESPAPIGKFLANAPEHGLTRYHQKFDLDELLIEYHLLRRILIEQLAATMKRSLSPDESIAINGTIDVALRRAAVAFSNHLSEKITNESGKMSKYLSFMSHDLRGGLNSAVLMIEVLRRDLMNEPKFAASLEDLDIARRSMLETVSTMDRFLQTERLRSGKVAIQNLDVRELLDYVVRNSRYQTKNENAPIEVQVNAPHQIQADHDGLVVILQNLVGNAIKYCGGGAVRIVSGAHGDKGVRISVTDEGPGIAPDKLATLFAPFTRGETFGQKGSGLGLTIARQTAELLGATLHAESSPGQGAAFHLDLAQTS